MSDQNKQYNFLRKGALKIEHMLWIATYTSFVVLKEALLPHSLSLEAGRMHPKLHVGAVCCHIQGEQTGLLAAEVIAALCGF